MDISELNNIDPNAPIQYTFENMSYRNVSTISVYGYGRVLEGHDQGRGIAFISISNKGTNDSRGHTYLTEDETEALILALTHALRAYRGD